ncbi:glycosyltransferase family 4 protein [uncultured Bacteroides sp.]|uniref:glycosyltransferase family 4 protein n=1 Tax=uncultured Bacteroides sp. TaxID=162156 RepID=UPI002602D757|nr:glycosyltransferase family 4 protein [uncultured Bacteroides sp.]
MKIIYTINSTYNSGGMEKVLCNKVNYFCKELGFDVIIITTEQKNRENFFSFDQKIKFIDLAINYDDDLNTNRVIRFFRERKKRKLHKRFLERIIYQEKPDICISMFDRDFNILHKIKDGSKKILEFHFCKKMKVLEQKNPMMKLIQFLRIKGWENIVSKYDRFVVLTDEDKKHWGNIKNINVIPNSMEINTSNHSDINKKNVLSIGRMSYQKGFDMLVQAWQKVIKIHPEWKLTIVGGGEKESIRKKICKLGLNNNIELKPPTHNIEHEYVNASIYVMSSRYEGLPMVLIEAMSYGLPIISFSCPCGPKDLIDKEYGILVKPNNIEELANSIIMLIESKEKRLYLRNQSLKRAKDFSKDRIMNIWVNLFNDLLSSKI